MTAFENHIGRTMLPSERIREREWIVSQILSPEQMNKRKELMKEVKPKQLKLF